MNRHRMGARGNATSFPLPWNELFKQFKMEEQNADAASSILPHSGEVLPNFVSVILKTKKDDDVDGRSLSKFIHQAIVRRRIVILLVGFARRRGHRAYRKPDMQQVEEKAA